MTAGKLAQRAVEIMALCVITLWLGCTLLLLSSG